MLGLRFCARAFSSCGKRGPLFIAARRPLTIAASCCGAQAPDVQAQQLWLTGPAAPRHVRSSQTRVRTRVPCTGRQSLNYCATREAPKTVALKFLSSRAVITSFSGKVFCFFLVFFCFCPFEWIIFSYFFICLVFLLLLKTGHLNLMMWWLWKSESPLSPGFAVCLSVWSVVGCLCTKNQSEVWT